MTEYPNTFAPLLTSVAIVKSRTGKLMQPIQVTDFYRSKPMDETLQELQQAAKDHNEHVLALVRDYGHEMRVNGTGPEVAEKYQAVVEALRKGAAS